MKRDTLDISVVTAAQNGDPEALETVVRHMQDRLHALAVRMMYDREHAMDATQEILIRIVTKLSTFKGESSFETWAFRVATNYLLTAKKVIAKDPSLTFNMFADDLAEGLVDETAQVAEDVVMLNEMRINCTIALLLCLDRSHRMAYILGDIFELDQSEASAILDVSKDTYRKRLSRARSEIVTFTMQSCGLANEAAACSCPRALPRALKQGRVSRDPDLLRRDAPDYQTVRAEAAATVDALTVTKLQRATGALKSPVDVAAHLQNILGPYG